jgi:hypothetical protein
MGLLNSLMRADRMPVTSPEDPRLDRMGRELVTGEDQIPQMLALSPRERLRWLVDMLDFEERAHRAIPIPKVR